MLVGMFWHLSLNLVGTLKWFSPPLVIYLDNKPNVRFNFNTELMASGGLTKYFTPITHLQHK